MREKNPKNFGMENGLCSLAAEYTRYIKTKMFKAYLESKQEEEYYKNKTLFWIYD